MDDTLPQWREIASQVLTNKTGLEAWVEMDAAGHLTVRCTGCGLDEHSPAMAPALFKLVEHAVACDQDGAPDQRGA